MRQLLQDGDLPESWIPPEIVLEWREKMRLYKALVYQRTQWVQRIHAELYQHLVAVPQGQIRYEKTQAALTHPGLAISAAGRQRIAVVFSMIHASTAESKPLKLELTRFGRRQPACRSVASQYGSAG